MTGQVRGVPPHPSGSVPHWVAPHVVIGVQQAPAVVHTSPELMQPHVMVLVQLSLKLPHLPPMAGLSHVYGVQPHTPAVHGPLEQSALPPQALPGAHVAPQLPPQSTSVSAPFLTPSEHDAV